MSAADTLIAPVTFSHLMHAHGGKILSIESITHYTSGRGRTACSGWEYVGAVEWRDGSKSPKIAIAAYNVSYKPDDPDSNAEYTKLSDALMRYLNKFGEWTHDDRHAWKPRHPNGSVPLATMLQLDGEA